MNHTFSAALGCEPWVNPAASCVPGDPGCPGTANPDGKLSRTAFHGPGFADTDLSVFRTFAIGERLKIQLRAEMFNVFNRINLAAGAGSVGSNGVVSDTIGVLFARLRASREGIPDTNSRICFRPATASFCSR